jgi:hypothetical protein
VVIVLVCLGWNLVVQGAGFFLGICGEAFAGSLAPTGFVSFAKHVNDINPVGARLAREAFNA